MASKASNDRPLHSIPIPERAPINPLRTYGLTLFFALVFLGMHLSQVVLYPLSWLPGGLRALYWDYVRFSKESFARVLVWISSETTLVITCDSSIRLQDVLEKDESGKVIGLKLKQRAVIVSNHQQYGDWIYLWSFFYASSLAGAVVIILKASLQYIPIGGPAMKLWDFVFLASSWETDRGPTGKNLRTLGTRASKYKKSLALLVFPEGTLVSKLTRPGSARFAERIGEPDMRNMILPRSTGLLFCLRTLLPVTPDLALYDITIGYPGVPPAGYAQSYYTLSSIYSGDGAPPTVHMHLRSFDLAQVPIGIVDAALSPDEADEAVTADERKAFDVWTRERWTEKDELLDEFYKAGEFPAEEGQRVEIPIGLRGFDDYLAVASNFVAVYAAWRLMKWAMALCSSS